MNDHFEDCHVLPLQVARSWQILQQQQMQNMQQQHQQHFYSQWIAWNDLGFTFLFTRNRAALRKKNRVSRSEFCESQIELSRRWNETCVKYSVNLITFSQIACVRHHLHAPRNRSRRQQPPQQSIYSLYFPGRRQETKRVLRNLKFEK